MSEEFMNRMLESYDRVHNSRYWQEITFVISSKEFNQARIADLGCGPGLLLADIARRYLPKELIGIDLSPIMLDRAEEELTRVINGDKEKKFKITTIQQHLQEDTSLPDNLDMMFSSRVLRSFEDQPAIIQSIHNSLRKEGYLVLLDWNRASIATYDNWFSSIIGEFDNLSPDEVITYHRNFSRYDLEDWRYILSNYQFNIIHQFQLDTVHTCTIAQK